MVGHEGGSHLGARDSRPGRREQGSGAGNVPVAGVLRRYTGTWQKTQGCPERSICGVILVSIGGHVLRKHLILHLLIGKHNVMLIVGFICDPKVRGKVPSIVSMLLCLGNNFTFKK